MKILLVDNEIQFAENFKILLSKKLKHEIILCSNGEEAKKKLAEIKDFDLLLTDIEMPAMGGEELVKWLREESFNLKIYIISGLFEEDFDSIKGLYDRSFSKPTHWQELSDAISNDFPNKLAS